MSKEPNGVLVMTTCKCREHGTNLVMSRTWFEEQLANKIQQGARQEQERIIQVLEQAKDLETKGIASWFGLQSAIIIIKGETK
jgi:hypothetical protein